MQDEPLAYLITFHTYGTWLPGDNRGYVHRRCNQYGAAYAPAAPRLVEDCQQRLIHAPVILSDPERALVGTTIVEVCRHRCWEILVADIRTDHVHAVVRSSCPPSHVTNALKAWSTRRLVEAGHRPPHSRVWVRNGSTRMLWNPVAVNAACRYVAEG